MAKIKEGDKVVCLRGNVVHDDCYDSRIQQGDTYIIQYVHGVHLVELQGVRGRFYIDRFTTDLEA